MEEMSYYIVFPNVTEALQLEKKLKENNIGYTIAPTPRELSNCCGISIKYSLEDEVIIKGIVEENEIKALGFHGILRKRFDLK